MSGHRGGLLELVARGKKDAFFTSNPQTSFFHSVFRKYAAFTEEVHLTAPRNNPEWGRWCEFDFEHRGDIVRKMYLRIELPTWLPAEYAAVAGRTLITDPVDGVSYGYCNNIGFQVIEKIQFLQDQVILQELYGEYLDWKIRQGIPTATALVLASAVGSRGETALEIGRAAIPGILRVPIPLIGWEAVGNPGLPMVALKEQRFRIRVLLRPLESVVVASDGRLAPKPWGRTLQIQRSAGGPQEAFDALPYESVRHGNIGLMLETTQVYVPCDIQEWLKVQKWQIPYRTVQNLEITIPDNQMHAATVAVANFTLPYAMDMTGAATRLLIALQTPGARKAGQRTMLAPDTVVRQLRLNISNIDRIQGFGPTVFRDFTTYWKNVRSAQDLMDPTTAMNVYTMVFGGKESQQPAGTLNFARSMTPSLWILFGPTEIDPRTQSRELALITYLETFNVLEVMDGKARVIFGE
jgi:hypothetical protein